MSPSDAVRDVNAGVLRVRGLRVRVEPQRGEAVSVVDGVDLDLAPGRRLALVGESGSGKSVTASALMGLTDYPLVATADEMTFNGNDLLHLSDRQWRDVRGAQLALIQQDPLTALSPVFTVGSQVAETIARHLGVSRRQAMAQAIDRMAEAGIPDARLRAGSYPHQLSGGLRQRVAIAMALSANPVLLLADEPTTALDVTVQAQILELLRRLSDESGTGVVLITHDLGVIAGFAHELAVMYSGRIVESGPVARLLGQPRHPYTVALLAAQPGRAANQPRRRIAAIVGAPPAPARRPAGCAFAPRCPIAIALCQESRPPLRVVAGREVACHLADSMATLGAQQ